MPQKPIIKLELNKELSISELIDTVYPRVLAALNEEGITPEQVNEIRLQVGTIIQYINKKIPTEIKGRMKRLKKANAGNKLYITACRKAGDAWMQVEKYRGRPVHDPDPKQPDLFLEDKSVTSLTLLTTEEAGFGSRRDALQCVRAAKLHEEDLRIYFQECDLNNRQYTLNGIESVWRELNPSREGENVAAIDPPLSERLKAIITKLEGLLSELPKKSDDVIHLIDQAIAFLTDAEEIMQ